MLINMPTACEHSDQLIDYLYNEIGDVERVKFEAHLTSCVACTEEFASLSNTRSSLIKWRKEEFDTLVTPQIVIPKKPSLEKVAGSDPSWLTSLAAFVSFARSPYAVATAILMFIGIALLALTFMRTGELLIASNGNAVVNVISVNETEKNDSPSKSISEVNVANTNNGEQPMQNPSRATSVNLRKPTQVSTKVRVNVEPRRTQRTKNIQRLELSEYREEPDNSLRLTDLFDEIGG